MLLSKRWPHRIQFHIFIPSASFTTHTYTYSGMCYIVQWNVSLWVQQGVCYDVMYLAGRMKTQLWRSQKTVTGSNCICVADRVHFWASFPLKRNFCKAITINVMIYGHSVRALLGRFMFSGSSLVTDVTAVTPPSPWCGSLSSLITDFGPLVSVCDLSKVAWEQ